MTTCLISCSVNIHQYCVSYINTSLSSNLVPGYPLHELPVVTLNCTRHETTRIGDCVTSMSLGDHDLCSRYRQMLTIVLVSWWAS
jgi:hypothetical protein